MKSAVKIILILLSIAYPFLIFFGIKNQGASFFQFLFLGLIVLYALSARKGNSSAWLWVLACSVLVVWMTVSGSAFPAKLYPVTISVGLALLFAASLIRPPSMVERFARLKDPDLPPEGVEYTRQVTKIWLAFFVFNASVSAYTSLRMSDESWLLYNGLISYLLIGLLFAGELLARKKIIKS